MVMKLDKPQSDKNDHAKIDAGRLCTNAMQCNPVQYNSSLIVNTGLAMVVHCNSSPAALQINQQEKKS